MLIWSILYIYGHSLIFETSLFPKQPVENNLHKQNEDSMILEMRTALVLPYWIFFFLSP